MKQARVNWFYLLVGLLFVSMLYVSFRFFRGSRSAVVGITKSKDYKINSEKSSVVKAIHVVPGKLVKEGELLIELSSNELEIDIAKLTNRIAVLTSEQQEKSKLVDSEIAYIKAEQGITIDKIESDITQTESEIKLNRQLTRQFGNAGDTLSTEAESPLQLKINSLQQQKLKHQQAMDIKVRDVLQESNTELNQLSNQITLLTHELELLKEERKKLSKYASADGVVENVYVREGEQVDAFAPLLSVNPVRPAMVVGYLSGPGINMSVGATVTVSSYGDRSAAVQGKVIGFGSVSELPDILQKSTAVKAFGREVFIEIPGDNQFANGEKVLIR